MASGCIPDKKDRIAAVRYAKEQLREAIELLEKVDDPDADKVSARLVEAAAGAARNALGQRAGTFIDTEVPLGLEDLTEHYFS